MRLTDLGKRSRSVRLTRNAVSSAVPMVESLEVRRLMTIVDLGDAPDTYGTTFANNGPYHDPTGIGLGVGRTGDADGQPSVAANLDAGDDGVFIGAASLQDLTLSGPTANLTVKITTDYAPETTGFLHGWIDFDGNGTFDAAYRIASNVPVAVGDIALAVTIPG